MSKLNIGIAGVGGNGSDDHKIFSVVTMVTSGLVRTGSNLVGTDL